MDQDTRSLRLVQVPSDPLELARDARAVKAQHHVSETTAYAMLVRAAAGGPPVPVQRSGDLAAHPPGRLTSTDTASPPSLVLREDRWRPG